MQDAIWIAAIIATFTALIAYYERKTVRLELQLDSALDELEKRSDIADEPPFNLQLDPVAAQAFHLDPHPGWTQEQIDEWN